MYQLKTLKKMAKLTTNVREVIADALSEQEREALHGCRGSFIVDTIRRGTIRLDCIFSFYNEGIYACQNELDGADCDVKWGQRYSWRLSNETLIFIPPSTQIKINVMSRRLLQTLTDPEFVKEHRMELCLQRILNMTKDVEFTSNKTLNGHHFDLRKGEISYYPNNVPLAMAMNGTWAREGRVTFKVGKFIKMLLETESAFITADGDLLDISNREDAKLITSFFEIKSGLVKSTAYQDCIKVSDDPSAIYGMETAENSGTLASSCMRPESGHGCHEGMDWYSMIGTKIAYIANPKTDELCARALLWENCYFVQKVDDRRIRKVGAPFTFLDRIYGDEASMALMKEWAKEQGYFYKSEQSSRSNTLISPTGEVVSKQFIWDKEITEVSEYSPYMDTFVYLYGELKRLGTGAASDTSGCDLTDSSGDAFDNVQICPNCGKIAPGLHAIGLEDSDLTGPFGCVFCAVETANSENSGTIWFFKSDVLEYYDLRGMFRIIPLSEAKDLNIVSAYYRGRGLVNVEIVKPEPMVYQEDEELILEEV